MKKRSYRVGKRKRKKKFTREHRNLHRNIMRARGSHDIAWKTNELRGWSYRNWSLDGWPQGMRRSSNPRLEREDLARNDYGSHKLIREMLTISLNVTRILYTPPLC